MYNDRSYRVDLAACQDFCKKDFGEKGVQCTEHCTVGLRIVTWRKIMEQRDEKKESSPLALPPQRKKMRIQLKDALTLADGHVDRIPERRPKRVAPPEVVYESISARPCNKCQSKYTCRRQTCNYIPKT